MGKRFTDTEKWTKNKWFRKLSKDLKLFWLFILDNCDCVGVWEEDIEFVNEIMGTLVKHEEAIKSFAEQIHVIQNGKKWWITNFCFYQYGELKEENIKNKPHQKYISELKKHRLWIDYTKTLQSLKEEDKEEDQEKETEEEIKNLQINPKLLIPEMSAIWKRANPSYVEQVTKDFDPLLKIAKFLCDGEQINFDLKNKDCVTKIKSNWKIVTDFIVADNFYKMYNLILVEKHIQAIVQKIHHGNTVSKQQSGKVTSEQLHTEFNDFYSQK
jgi:hypothetical protein